jgi:hypothetical protein
MYYKRNLEKVQIYNQLNYINNKDSILESQKQYRESNKGKIIIARAKYYEKNKEQIAAKKEEKMVCKCGQILNVGNIYKHLKTNKHMKRLEAKIQF